MEDWAALLSEQEIDKPGRAIAYLKTRHGLDHAAAHRVALIVNTRSIAKTARTAPTDDPFEALYSGSKSGLRPTHERLMAFLDTLGLFEMAPKKGYVSLRRSKQFAMIQPGARWVNLGLVLPGTPPGPRLESAETFNALFTHRVRVAAVEDVDGEL